MNLNIKILSLTFLMLHGTSFAMIMHYKKENKEIASQGIATLLHKKNTSVVNEYVPSPEDFGPYNQLKSLFPKETMMNVAIFGDRITKSRLRETCHLYKQYLTIEDNPAILKTLAPLDRKYLLLNAWRHNNDKLINAIKPFADNDAEAIDNYFMIGDPFIVIMLNGCHIPFPKNFYIHKLQDAKKYIEDQKNFIRDIHPVDYEMLRDVLMVSALCGDVASVKKSITGIKEAYKQAQSNDLLGSVIKIIEEGKVANNQRLLFELVKQDYEQIFEIIIKEDPYNVGDDKAGHGLFFWKLATDNISEYKKKKYTELYTKYKIKDAL